MQGKLPAPVCCVTSVSIPTSGSNQMTDQIRITPATPADVPTIRALVRELAEFEQLLHEANATDEQIHESLFGPKPGAEVIMARVGDEVAGFALFFHNF